MQLGPSRIQDSYLVGGGDEYSIELLIIEWGFLVVLFRYMVDRHQFFRFSLGSYDVLLKLPVSSAWSVELVSVVLSNNDISSADFL